MKILLASDKSTTAKFVSAKGSVESCRDGHLRSPTENKTWQKIQCCHDGTVFKTDKWHFNKKDNRSSRDTLICERLDHVLRHLWLLINEQRYQDCQEFFSAICTCLEQDYGQQLPNFHEHTARLKAISKIFVVDFVTLSENFKLIGLRLYNLWNELAMSKRTWYRKRIFSN